MSVIKIKVDEQNLFITDSPKIAAQGVKENYVEFTFSDDWIGFGVTAIFYVETDPETIYTSLVDANGRALVPHEITASEGRICLGISGVKDDVIKTSEILTYKIVKGLYVAESSEPSPGIYEQMLTIAGAMIETVNQIQADNTAFKNEIETDQAAFTTQISNQFAQFIASHSGTVTGTKRTTSTLWEGDVIANGSTITLSDDPHNYNYIEVFYAYGGYAELVRFTAAEFYSSSGVYIRTPDFYSQHEVDTTEPVAILELQLVKSENSDTVYTLNSGLWSWEGRADRDGKITALPTASPTNGIRRITGIKYEQVTAEKDAELTDIRVGADGTIYETAGAAVRGQFDKIEKNLIYEYEPISYDETTGKLIDRNTREISDIASVNYAVSNIISVIPGERYLINVSMNYGHYLYVFYDANDTAFGGEKSNTGSTITTLTDELITIPIGAVGIRLGYATSFNNSLSKEKVCLIADGLTDIAKDEISAEINGAVQPINNKLDGVGLVSINRNLLNPDTVLSGYMVDANGVVYAAQNYTLTDYIEVEVDKKYSVFATSNNKIIGLPVTRIYAYSDEKEPVSNLGSLSYSSIIPNTVTIPSGAKYIRVGIITDNYTSFGTVMLSETKGESMPSAIVPYGNTQYGITKNGKWINKKWTAVGDSLTEVNDRTTKHYHDYIAEITGIEVVNMGESGTGYMRKYDTGHAFYNRIVNVPKDSDLVTIFGSLNDLGNNQQLGTIDDTISDGTIFGYVNGTIDALYTAFPKVNLGIISPTPWASSEPWNAENNSTKYCEGLKQICFNRGIPFLDLYHCSNLRPWDATARELFYSKDDGNGTHPDEEGHKMITPKFLGFLDSLLI